MNKLQAYRDKLLSVFRLNPSADEGPIEIGKNLNLHRDMGRYANIGWIFLVGSLVLLLIWASFAPLDRGIPASGYVISDTNKKEIKYLIGGVVDQLLVRDGDFVKAGQTLIKMNPTLALATSNSTSESIAGIEEHTKGLEASLKEKRKQLVFAQKQASGLEELSKEGFVPMTKLYDAKKEVAQLQANIAEELGSIEKNKKQIRELSEKNIAYQYDLDNTIIKSPVDGYVVGLTVFSDGVSITPGAHLMDIVPANDLLIVEAQVPVNLIDKVKTNIPAEILFTAFNQNRTPHIPARIIMVSADKYQDEKTGSPYFKVRAVANEEGVRLLKNLNVRPGMPAELLIKTGERTLMSYLLKPFFDRSYFAFREE